MEEQKKKTGLKPKLQKAKAKLLASYYSHPAKDLKVIIITGKAGRASTAHYLQECLKSIDPKTGLILDPATTSSLYKQLSEIWRIGANHVVITMTTGAITSHLLYRLPIFMTVNTDGKTEQQGFSVLSNISTESDAKAILYNTQPEFNIISHDHPDYDTLSNYPVKTASFSYGHDRESDLRINRSKLYKKGTEANLSYGKDFFDVATYLVGEESIDYMAAAAMAAIALGISYDDITDGIANYEPTA